MGTNLKWEQRRKCLSVSECSLRNAEEHTFKHFQQDAVDGAA